MTVNAFCLGTVSSSFFFAVFALLLLKADDLMVGKANGMVVELDLTSEVGGTRDGLGRRLLLVDATIPSRGLVVCFEALTYIERVSNHFSWKKIEKATYLV
jgi:hypothetical protein